MDASLVDIREPFFIVEGSSPDRHSFSRGLVMINKNLAYESGDRALIPHPSIGFVHEYELVGSINGLLCLKKFDENKYCVFVICNPITGQMIETRSPARLTNGGRIIIAL